MLLRRSLPRVQTVSHCPMSVHLFLLCSAVVLIPTVNTAPSATSTSSHSNNQRLSDLVTNYTLFEADFSLPKENDGTSRHTFNFVAFGQSFEVVTFPHTQLLHDSGRVEVHHRNGTTKHVALNQMVNENSLRKGHISGDTYSSVSLRFHDSGTKVQGTILSSNGIYWLTPGSQFSDLKEHETKKTVVYKHEDIKEDKLSKEQTSSFCGSQSHKRLKAKQRDIVPTSSSDNMFSEERKRRSSDGDRGAGGAEFCAGACTCPVTLVADHTYFAGPYGESDIQVTTSKLVDALMASDLIYYNTDFGGIQGVGLSVRDVIIYESNDSPGNPVPGSYSDGVSFLEDFGNGQDIAKRLSDTCLALMFTHREFSDGLLGLAWVSERGNNAGICSSSGYNTAFVTTLNFGSTVQKSVNHITVAHELGHNFGSPHDETAECSPGGSDGNYIMFPQATDGAKINNRLFSSCSSDIMSVNLDAKKDGCFSAQREVCGNGFVEGDEECDCGSQCSETNCCNTECKVPDDVQCSPQNTVKYPCCTEDCMYVSADTNLECFKAYECLASSTCNGESAECPDAAPVEDGTACGCQMSDCDQFPETSTKYCDSGSCNVSICELYNAQDCEIEGKACEVACIGEGWGDGDSCVSTFSDDKPEAFGDGRWKPAGSPCLNYQGYCDQGGTCVIVEADKVLDKLKEALSGLSADSVWQWISSNWLRSGGILAAIVFVAVALFLTRRKVKHRYSYESLDDDGNSVSGGVAERRPRRRRGTFFENATSKH